MKILILTFLLATGYASCPKEEYEAFNERFHFNLPSLPYEYSALEPLLWSQVLYYHHQKEHRQIVNELNQIVASDSKYYELTVTQLLTKYGAENNLLAEYAGGHYGHSLQWWTLMPPNCTKSEPEGDLHKAITEKWGTFKEFKDTFTNYAKELFGSGWVWLCTDRAEDLSLLVMRNNLSPLSGNGCYPFLGLDVWEHSYYLYYLFDRNNWITVWWDLIDWDLVEYWYEEYASQGEAIPI